MTFLENIAVLFIKYARCSCPGANEHVLWANYFILSP